MNVLKKHKDFITAVALHAIKPDKSNMILNEVLEAYKSIDDTVEVLAECSTCEDPFKDSFKIILAYCENKNWFENEGNGKANKGKRN